MGLVLATSLVAAAVATAPATASDELPEVLVFGSVEESKAWLEAENWWGPNEHETQLQAPRVLITGITNRWLEESQQMTVAEKKEGFYRLMLPLVLYANELVLKRRAELEDGQVRIAAGEALITAAFRTGPGSPFSTTSFSSVGGASAEK